MTKAKFKPIFLALCEMFDKGTVSPQLTRMYFETLHGAGMTDIEFDRAAKQILLTRKYSSLPKPGEILESIKGDPEAQALFALQELENAMRAHGSYASVTFIDTITGEIVANHEGGWIGLCKTPSDEWTWVKKDFIKLYRAKLTSGNYGREPVKQIGRTEDSGNTTITPVLIGDKRDTLINEITELEG